MTPSQLMQAMADAGAPMEAIIIAVRALEEKDAVLAEQRAAARDRKRRQRERDGHVTVTGQSEDSPNETSLSRPPNEINSNPPTHTHRDMNTRASDGENPPAKPKRARPVRTAGVDHPMPDGWEPILTERAQKIVDGWPPGMWSRELSKFRNHAADKGRLSKDWQAAFRTWIDNAEERRTANGQSNIAHLRPSGGASPDRRSSLARACDEGLENLEWLAGNRP